MSKIPYHMDRMEDGRWLIWLDDRFTVRFGTSGNRAVIDVVVCSQREALVDLREIIADALVKAFLPRPRTIELMHVMLDAGSKYVRVSHLETTAIADELIAGIARNLQGKVARTALVIDNDVAIRRQRLASDIQERCGWAMSDAVREELDRMRELSKPTRRVATIIYPTG